MAGTAVPDDKGLRDAPCSTGTGARGVDPGSSWG